MINKNKTGAGIIIAISLLIVVGFAGYFVISSLLKPAVIVQLGDGIFRAQIINYKDKVASSSAYTISANEMSTEVLGANQGFKSTGEALLAIFPTESKWKVSLSDVTTSIDVLWLNSDKEVVYIVKNVSPDEVKGETYEPNSSAKYIMQFMAGTVDNTKIRIGDKASFEMKGSE